MDKKKTDIASSAVIQSALQTSEGKKFMAHLQANGGKSLEQAMALIKKGDCEQAVAVLKPIMETKETQQLIKQIQQKIG